MVRRENKVYAKPFLDDAFIPGGRPEHYPTPELDDQVLFIQRNYNTDTIIYQINRDNNGFVDGNEPLNVFWLKYNDGGHTSKLNYLQRKLAYGYEFREITKDLFEFQFVSYPKIMYLAKQPSGVFRVVTSINNVQSVFTNAYIYAEENGVFPDVKFVEFYGFDLKTAQPVYEKLRIE